MKSLVWLVSLFSALMLTVETYAQDKPNPLTGSRLFRSYCLVCHGVDGKSKGPVAKKLNLKPADLSSAKYQTRNVKDLADIIGGYWKKQATKMPNWGKVLPQTDLLDIASYIPHLTQKDLRFRGDTRRGRVIYKITCASCHGQFGTGRGPLADLMNIPMIDFTKSEDMEKLTDEKLITITREGKGEFMASWKGTLNDGEITDVVAYIRMLAR